MYIGTTQAAELLNISTSRVRKLIAEGRVKGARKLGNIWIIPLFEGMPIITSNSIPQKPKWGIVMENNSIKNDSEKI